MEFSKLLILKTIIYSTMHNSRYSKCMDHTVIKAQKISKTIMSE